MLYEFAGVKVEVKETPIPKGMVDPIAVFDKQKKGIVMVWKDSVEEIKLCEHCDEAWDIDTVFADFDYTAATEKGLDFTYTMSEAELEEEPYWQVMVCPVCAMKFKKMGLTEQD